MPRLLACCFLQWCWVVSIGRLGSITPNASFSCRAALVWFILDAFTHLTMELCYVMVTLIFGGAVNTDSPLAFMWKEYGKADKRWAVYDANILSLEFLTVFVMGPLAALMVYAVSNVPADGPVALPRADICFRAYNCMKQAVGLPGSTVVITCRTCRF